MPVVVVPIAALAALVVVALIAKERKYEMTSTGLMVVAGVLATWLAGMVFLFG